jgi:3-isopropylmalate/(R)-2-methylmalate dehydratase large subunit
MGSMTLYDKLWDRHVVDTLPDGSVLLYIDRHLLHEVTTPQAFAGLRRNSRPVWRLDTNLAVPDHAVPTRNRELGVQGIADPLARLQVSTLESNCDEYLIPLFNLMDQRQGIVHVIGPEQGLTLPGMTLVCGDSHTATHGAFATLSQGVGSSEVEHVLATQTLRTRKLRNMRIFVQGKLDDGVTAKDLILHIIGLIGTSGGTGHAIEYTGEVISRLSMEARMTLCNMSIEAGARVGLIAYDQQTEDYLKDRPFAPKGDQWDQAIEYWRTLHSDPGSTFDSLHQIDASLIEPQVSWGTSPEMVCGINGSVPDPAEELDKGRRQSLIRSLEYMGLKPGIPLQGLPVDRVFIGSCTNARIEDLRAAAAVVKGKRLSGRIRQAMVVPGSGLVRLQAEREGLDEVFMEAGFEWRAPGCSMCLGMNPDRLLDGERCASTSNRNFEGRQGKGGRTHLMSPQMAAAAAVTGFICDHRSI